MNLIDQTRLREKSFRWHLRGCKRPRWITCEKPNCSGCAYIVGYLAALRTPAKRTSRKATTTKKRK